MRATPNLLPLGKTDICVRTNNQTYPNVAFNGTNYVVVYSDPWFSGATTRYLAATRVTPSGVVLDTGACLTGATGASEDNPDIAFDGSRCLVVWQKNNVIQGLFINSSALPEGSIFTIGFGSGPAIAFDGTDYAVAWFTGTYPSLNIQTRTVSTTGSLGTTMTVTTDSDCNRWPDITFDGTRYLLVWMKGINSPTSQYIYGQFIAPDGALNGVNFTISDNTAGQRWFPAVASSDANYLIVYDQNTSSSNLYGNADVPVGCREDSGMLPGALDRRNLPTYYTGDFTRFAGGRFIIRDITGRRIKNSAGPGVYFIETTDGIVARVIRLNR